MNTYDYALQKYFGLKLRQGELCTAECSVTVGGETSCLGKWTIEDYPEECYLDPGEYKMTVKLAKIPVIDDIVAWISEIFVPWWMENVQGWDLTDYKVYNDRIEFYFKSKELQSPGIVLPLAIILAILITILVIEWFTIERIGPAGLALGLGALLLLGLVALGVGKKKEEKS